LKSLIASTHTNQKHPPIWTMLLVFYRPIDPALADFLKE
jgi:hypothetical protein